MRYFEANAMIHQCGAVFPHLVSGGGTGTIQGTPSRSCPAMTPALEDSMARGLEGPQHTGPQSWLWLWRKVWSSPHFSGPNSTICKIKGLNYWAKRPSNLPVHHNSGNMAKIQFPRTYFLLSGLASVISQTILPSFSPFSPWPPEHQ